MNFKELHQQATPLLIGNVWDVKSAQIAEKLNFQAIATSSAAMADLLGYEDGEKMSFEELAFMVKRIAVNTNLPLSVDLEGGYSRSPSIIVNHLKQLADLGVVGVNIEDTVVQRKRTFLPAEEFAQTLSEIVKQLKKDRVEIFLNIRTDAFLLEHANRVEETKKRIHLYENAGADGIFIPCITQKRDIEKMVKSTSLPINVMCMPDLSDFEQLKELRVQRISMGNFIFANMYQYMETTLASIVEQDSFKTIF